MPLIIYDPKKEPYRKEGYNPDAPDLIPDGISEPIDPAMELYTTCNFGYEVSKKKAPKGVEPETVFKGVTLRPWPRHVNMVSRADYEGIRHQNQFRGLVEYGSIKVIEEVRDLPSGKLEVNLSDFYPEELSTDPKKCKEELKLVKEIVELVFDDTLLQEWLQTTSPNYQPVWSILAERIGVLTNPSAVRTGRRRRR